MNQCNDNQSNIASPLPDAVIVVHCSLACFFFAMVSGVNARVRQRRIFLVGFKRLKVRRSMSASHRKDYYLLTYPWLNDLLLVLLVLFFL
jgi:hypothetical protein